MREDGTPYYVGKFSRLDRPYDHRHNVRVPKDPYRILIQEHPSEADAFAAEIFLIAYYGRKDISTGILRANPASVVRDVFSGVAEIEQVFLSNDGDRGIATLIVIGEKNYDVLQHIFDLESNIIKALPGTPINFDVVIRDGRPLGEIVNPRGRLLFQR